MTPDKRRRARHAAHVVQTWHRSARIVQDLTGLDDAEQAMTALEVVVGDLAARLVPDEAHDLLAQLPSELREAVERRLADGHDAGLTRQSIEADLVRRLEVSEARAEQLVVDVGLALEQLVSPGEIRHVRAQLPEDLRSILPDEVAHLTP